jgi:RNA 2',3'-cyclic 3'-phosphodiesterase
MMSDKKNTIRTFIAVKPPVFLKTSLNNIQGVMQANKIKAKYIPVQNIHLTIKFIGNMDTALLPEIQDILIDSTQYFKPIKLALKGIGVFPKIKFPKVIWSGVKGETHKLESLHKKLEQGLSTLGIQREKRKYQGHLTFARIKQNKLNRKKLESVIEQIGDFESDRFTTDKLILFQSRLMPDGPIYSELFSAKFGVKL